MIGNKIGDEGAQSISEMLQVNTTLTSLNLECEKNEKWRKGKNDEQMTDNSIGDEGAKALGEMLQVNTTLTSLDLACEDWWKWSKEEKWNEW